MGSSIAIDISSLSLDSSLDSTLTASSYSDDETTDFDSISSSQTSEDFEAELMEMEMDIGLDGISELVPMDWRLSGKYSDSECESSSSGGDADGETELKSE